MMQDSPFWDAVMWVPILLVLLGVPYILWRMVARMLPVAGVILYVAAALHWHEVRARRR
jgi:hypothetical protein